MSVRTSIDLNSDLGEHDDFAQAPDAEILRYVSSANLSCGVHAGSPDAIEATVHAAIAGNVAIGAHPSYPDRHHFGRRSMELPVHELAAEVRSQILWLKQLVERCGGQLRHVKPHGALYTDMAANEVRAAMMCDVMRDIDPALALVGLAGARTADLVRMHGIRYLAEGFADRRYEDSGALRARVHDDAVLTDPAEVLAQVDRLLELPLDTLCLHGDTPHARELSRAIHDHVVAKGLRVAAA